MNVLKAINVIKKRKFTIIHNTYYEDKNTGDLFPSAQWISNGYAAYPLEKIPTIDEHAFIAMIGQNEDKYTCSVQDGMSFDISDSKCSDVRLDYGELEIKCYSLYYARSTPVFLNSDFLTPFVKDEYDLFFRDGKYVVVKEGFLVKSVIMPIDIAKKILHPLQTLCAAIGDIPEAYKGEDEDDEYSRA